MQPGWSVPPTDAALNVISQEFCMDDLRNATNNFNSDCQLGEGSYGTVFRGCLRDGTEVAIKALSQPKEGGFREEVEVLSRFRQPNLVILLGFARNAKERYLVYELLPGGDVHSRMMKDQSFTWKPRLNVCLDSSLGLSHLHHATPQVFHRDIKSQNILMDRNGTGKVADFGLACLAKQNQKSLLVSQTSGTVGYADPLYIRTGVVTEASEVYSFGMVMLEILTGRPPALQHPTGRIEYQFEHVRGDLARVMPMVDNRGQWPPGIVQALGTLALRCICPQPEARPTFVDLVKDFRSWLRNEALCQMPGPSPSPAAPRAQDGRQVIQGQGAAHFAPQGAGGYGHQAQPQQVHQAQPQQVQRHPEQAFLGAQPNRQPNPSHAPNQRPQQASQQPQQPAAVNPRPAAQSGQAAAPYNPFAPAAQPSRAASYAQAQPAPPAPMPQGDASREADIAQLLNMGFTEAQAEAAFKRCSSVEAAAEWILTSGLDEG